MSTTEAPTKKGRKGPSKLDSVNQIRAEAKLAERINKLCESEPKAVVFNVLSRISSEIISDLRAAQAATGTAGRSGPVEDGQAPSGPAGR